MRVQIDLGGIAEIKADTLVIPITRHGETPKKLPQGLSVLDQRMGGRLSDALAAGDFQGNVGDRLVVYGPRDGGLVRCLLLGLGESDAIDDEGLRLFGGRVGRELVRAGVGRVALVVPAAAALAPERSSERIAEGAVLGAYRFERYKRSSNGRDAGKDGGKDGKKKPRASSGEPRLRIVYARKSATKKSGGLGTLRAGVRRTLQRAESQVAARDLSNEPPNALYPETLAQAARRMARAVGLRCRVMNVAELERRGMGAILAVGQGSVHPPRLIVLEHGATAARKKRGTLALVGKAITFDSGGLSIKPAMGMPDMKHDMSGAAAVFGAMRAIALLDLPIHVVGLLSAAENMPSGTAYRPSDIIETASGQTVEIVNTDAEGRLVLADALHHAAKTYSPDAMVDIATLTGAAMMAFGPHASAGLGNDEALLEEVRAAGRRTGEAVWPMPLLAEHEKAMRSKVADWKNSAGGSGGISTAAAFLRGFVGDIPWVHLDIAGSGMTSEQTPLHVGGGTGVGVRLLTEWVRSRAQRAE